ncbi:MAG: decaprenyl-phosphate phosphoribosyltransferase [Candidatus Latescibacterota bacterium]|jgi:4-hydroxybenzoate polyprenyltransferase
MLYLILLSMRPRQWVKNAFVLPALLFSKHVLEWEYTGKALAAACCFCLLSGAVYLLNDVADAERDRLHPRKASRPVASGRLPASTALVAAVLVVLASTAWAFLLQREFGWVALLYGGINLAYSVHLKQVVLLDVLSVATGFLLRALGGAVVIQVPISPWFVLCSFTLALFLAVVKRRQELVALDREAGAHRAILSQYSLPFLDQAIAVLTSATLVCYALYAMGVGEQAAGHRMQWTIPFVLYGVFRYLYVVYQKGAGDSPTAVLWADRPLQLDLILWLAVSVLGYYVLP